jgi:pimeloyl-ACP methyl ester carboxylesterase
MTLLLYFNSVSAEVTRDHRSAKTEASCNVESQRSAFRTMKKLEEGVYDRNFFPTRKSKSRSARCPSLPKPHEQGQSPQADTGEIRSLRRSIATTSGGKKDFDFKYGFHDRGKKKTIVYIKGGPNSQSWIDKTNTDEFKDYNLIVVELPGAGYNKFDGSVDFNKEVNTTAAGLLVKEIVQKEGLQNYMIAGHSYGTTVATVATSLISQTAAMRKPSGALLMGTVGRANKQKSEGHEVTQGPKNASDKTFNSLTSEEKKKFKDLVEYLNSFADKPYLPNVLVGTLMGPISGDPAVGADYLKKLLMLSPEDVLACMEEAMQKKGSGQGESKAPSEDQAYAFKFYSYAGCELVSTNNKDDESHFFNNLLITKRPNACYCSSSSTAGTYDSAKWPMKNVPSYYVSAKNDFNTPPFQMDYHKRVQKGVSASQTVYQTESGGHGLGFFEMNKGQCSDALEGIFANSPNQFQTGMKTCTQTATSTLDEESFDEPNTSAHH